MVIINNIDDLKLHLEKQGFNVKYSLTQNSISFVSGASRKPKFIVGFDQGTKLFTLSIEATRSRGARGIIYTGKNLDAEGIIYMLKMEMDYFKNLKTNAETKKISTSRESVGSVRPDRFYRTESGEYKKKNNNYEYKRWRRPKRKSNIGDKEH